MNELSAILNNIHKFTTAELEALVQKFPYFQQGHLLLAKKYQQEGNSKFDQQLQLAALYTRDRELLYNLFKDADTQFSEFQSAEIEEAPISEITLPELPAIEEEPVEKQPEVVEEDVVLTPLINGEEFRPGESELSSIEEKPVLEGDVPLRDGMANDSSSINELIIDIEDKPEENEAESPPSEERAANEYTMTPLVFGDEQKTETIDEAPVTEEELEEAPPVQQAEQMLTPLVEPPIEKTEVFFPAGPHTFDEWLKMYAQSNAILREPKPEIKPVEIKDDKKDEELNELIVGNQSDYLHQLVKEETTYSPGLTKFIEQQIQKHKHAELKKPVSDNDLDADLITETMAKIYEMQKKYDKAIRAYEVLRLKFPEKNDTFAARIDHLKSLL